LCQNVWSDICPDGVTEADRFWDWERRKPLIEWQKYATTVSLSVQLLIAFLPIVVIFSAAADSFVISGFR